MIASRQRNPASSQIAVVLIRSCCQSRGRTPAIQAMLVGLSAGFLRSGRHAASQSQKLVGTLLGAGGLSARTAGPRAPEPRARAGQHTPQPEPVHGEGEPAPVPPPAMRRAPPTAGGVEVGLCAGVVAGDPMAFLWPHRQGHAACSSGYASMRLRRKRPLSSKGICGAEARSWIFGGRDLQSLRTSIEVAPDARSKVHSIAPLGYLPVAATCNHLTLSFVFVSLPPTTSLPGLWSVMSTLLSLGFRRIFHRRSLLMAKDMC